MIAVKERRGEPRGFGRMPPANAAHPDSSMAIEIEPLKPWIGRQKTVPDTLAPFAAAALTATLDRDDAPGSGEPLPPLWHWIYFHDPRRASELAENGHARLGRFMPPIP